MKRTLLDDYELGRLADVLARFEKRAIAFRLSERSGPAATRSRLGGRPLLPSHFDWPRSTERSLDFLLQIDLAEVSPLDPSGVLPPSGLLTFFYDLANQPWGYDPAHLDGFRVAFITDESLVSSDLPDATQTLPEHGVTFTSAVTLPHFGSRSYEQLERECHMSETETDHYLDFVAAYESQYYPKGSASHRMLGHSANVQNDMQLEAELVRNGLYCGDASGYNNSRAKALEAGADDWLLLLQLDSDDRADLMWGDVGMLYYWMRLDDLRARRFDRAWMTLQCG